MPREDAPQRFIARPIEVRRRLAVIDTNPPKAPISAPALGEFERTHS
jgi:hypothetical protein